MTKAPYESAAAPTSHSAAPPAEFNVVCRSKSNLPNRTDSNAALLPACVAGRRKGEKSKWAREGEGTGVPYRDPPASDLLALGPLVLPLFLSRDRVTRDESRTLALVERTSLTQQTRLSSIYLYLTNIWTFRMVKITLDDRLLAAYLFYGSILMLKTWIMSLLTSRHRLVNKVRPWTTCT